MSNTTVEVSGEARAELGRLMRHWSGWDSSTLRLTEPDENSPSQIGVTNHETRTFTVNVDLLLRNPNRVIKQVNPFRLRQEAVLTGVLMHEAGHARFSEWRQEQDNPDREQFYKLSPLAQHFAILFEELRVEKNMREAGLDGVGPLAWTMQASAASLIPLTGMDCDDPDEFTLQVLQSYILRAGRVFTSQSRGAGSWVPRLRTVLDAVLADHRGRHRTATATLSAQSVESLISSAMDSPGQMLLAASMLEDWLGFPQPPATPPPPCGGGSAEEQEQEQEQEQDQGQDQGQDQDQDQDQDPVDLLDWDQPSDPSVARMADLAKQLEKAEKSQKEQAAESGDQPTATTIRMDDKGRSFRAPTAEEREIQREAERFLRDMVNPTESTRVSTTSAPSSLIDPAEYAAWKAAGERTAPSFFRRRVRSVEPAPPVKIAVLVDVSMSMGILQYPSAVLSWSIAAAAQDLRNFAGRGQQIETTLIHWGSQQPTVEQHNGETLPGIREVPCNQFTDKMPTALDMVEQEIPGFFDKTDKPENRLLVQFTDWEFNNSRTVRRRLTRAVDAGVRMMTVITHGQLNNILYRESAQDMIAAGLTEVKFYEEGKAGDVWRSAANQMNR